MKELLAVGDAVRQVFVEKNKGQSWKLLVEEKKGDHWVGWTPNYIQHELQGEYTRGQVIDIRL